MPRYTIVFIFTLLFGVFQNCQNAGFSATEDDVLAKSSGVLIPVEEEAEGEILVPGAETDEGDGEDARGIYVCILEGPGKSVKLGFSPLDGQNPVPGVLCMSKRACLEIASLAFEVKGAFPRGYCGASGNPHVVHITDAELKKKIEAILAE